jgi:Secretion system C-terminal sorting domain/SprB repeat
MKRVIVLSFLTLLSVFSVYSQSLSNPEARLTQFDARGNSATGAFNYILTTFSEAYQNLTGATSVNNGEIWDEPEYIIPVSFPFELNGHAITQLQFYGSGAKLRSATEDPDISALLFPFETDLIDRGAFGNVSLSPISYKVVGDPGSRIEKIEWKNAGSYYEMVDDGTLNMYISFQLWLYEGSNTIEFHFGDSDIDDPERFYEGNLFVGLSDLNESEDDYVQPHFFAGSPFNPYLSLFEQILEGTPEFETVYKLSLNLPIIVEVNGTNNTSVCDPDGTAIVTATGGASPYTFEWTTGAITDTITHLSSGTYTVTVTDAAGSTATGDIFLGGPDTLYAYAGSTPETHNNADDGTAFCNPSGGSLPYTYLWNTGSTEYLITGLAPDIYSVTVTDHEGCSTSESVEVIAFVCDTLIIVSNQIHSTCFTDCNGSIVISGVQNGTEPFSFLWSNGSTTPEIYNLCPGFYTVTVTDTGGCEVIESYLITEPGELFANAGSTNETTSGANDGTAWALPLGGIAPYSYAWSNGSTDSLITNLIPGMYTVIVMDANGCADIDSIEVLPFPCMGGIEQGSTQITCYGACDGAAGVIILFGFGNETFLWNTGDTTDTITNLCPGQYTVTITNMFNCVATASFDIGQPDSIVFTIDSLVQLTDTTSGSIFISVTGGTPPFQYTWFGPNGFFSFGQDITNLEAGSYLLVAGDLMGCITTLDTIEILDLTVGIPSPEPMQVRIFPNPAGDQVYIDVEDITDIQIRLHSFDGRTLQTWFEEKTLDVSRIPSGVYLLEGISGNSIFRERLVIQK